MSAVDQLLPWMPPFIKKHFAGEFGEGWTDDDIVEEVERHYLYHNRSITNREHRTIKEAVRELRAESGTKEPTVAGRRRAGRPKGTRTHTRETIIEVNRRLQKNWGRNPTEQELADNFEPHIEVRTLQEHLRDYELDWPITE